MAAETAAAQHARMLAGGPWDTRCPGYTPLWARPPANGAPPFCDWRYRCLVCKGGKGQGGTGFIRARDVPCTDRAAHMLAWRHHAHTDRCAICPSTVTDEVLNDILGAAAVGASLQGIAGEFCGSCSRQAAVQALAPAPRPLAEHVRTEPCQPRRRNRIEPLRWCDNKYRCVICDQKGRTRMQAAKRQCDDPAAHMPYVLATTPLNQEEVVHFYGPRLRQLADDPDLLRAAAGGCAACKAACSG